MTSAYQLNEENERSDFCSKQKSNKHNIRHQTTTTKFETPDFGQEHTKCGGARHICWRQNIPEPETMVYNTTAQQKNKL